MRDNFDVQSFDLESLAEIGAMTDLMIAASDSHADRLSPEMIDRILSVRGKLKPGREPEWHRPLAGPRGFDGHLPRGRPA